MLAQVVAVIVMHEDIATLDDPDHHVVNPLRWPLIALISV